MMSGREAITRVLFLAGVCISGVCSVSQAQIVPSSGGPLSLETFARGSFIRGLSRFFLMAGCL
jgi:hypothetical protein